MYFDPDVLTRHAVCLGMTGSGKTGLCLSILEDLAARGIPILAVDPKGDLANLALVFPELSPAAFAPWTRDPEAASARWQANVPEGATAAWLQKVAVRVLTPGSESGVPVDVLSALTRAPQHLLRDTEGLRELVTGAVSALLGLVGRSANALRDPAAILLARLLGDAFAQGEDLPLDRLIPAVVDPPFDRIGVLALETFMPRDARLQLANELNAVIASPAVAPWRTGIPLDVGAWLAMPAEGEKTTITVLYLAHLDEPQRMFFITLLMHQVVAWTRRLSGSERLRALVYLDEVMGLLPPHPKDPPSKWPVLALMKQARAVGVGVMLSTQNPVDLDYKAMSNAATWLVGRLQTRQDRARVLDGLAAAGVDTAALDDELTSLAQRSFLYRGDGPPRTITSRHTLSFLRGPLTRAEISRLGPATTFAAAEMFHASLSAPPVCPEGLPARWLDPAMPRPVVLAGADELWRPALLARWAARFDDPGWVEDRVVHQLLFPADDPEAMPVAVEVPDASILRTAPPGGRYAALPGWMFERGAVARIKERWRDQVVREQVTEGPLGTVVLERGDVREVGFAVVFWRG